LNIVRKLKISKIQPVEFTKGENLIIKSVESKLSHISGYLQPDYYDEAYKDFTYYLDSNGRIIIRKYHMEDSIHVSKIFFNELTVYGIHIDEEEMKRVLVFFFKKYCLKQEPKVHVLASNYITDSFKSGWFFEIPL
jgi:hypothetical protein